MPDSPASSPLPDRALVGCYADDGEPGIRLLDASQDRPSWLPGGFVLRNASWLEWWDDRHLLAVSELPESMLVLLQVTANGLSEVSRSAVGGADACHLAISPDRRLIAVANYSSGSVSLFAAPTDHQLTEVVDVLAVTGQGPVADRQASAHCHQAVWWDVSHLLVCDLGADLVRVLRVVSATTNPDAGCVQGTDSAPEAGTASDVDPGSVTRQEPGSGSGPRSEPGPVPNQEPTPTAHLVEVGSIVLPPGFGPRHLVRRGDQIAVCGELSGELVSLRHTGTDPATGWTQIDRIAGSLRSGSQPSGLVFFGDDLVLANRTVDTLATVAWLPDGRLRLLREDDCGGVHPRDLVSHHGSLWVANQHDNQVTRLDLGPDGFTPTASIEATAPARILFPRLADGGW